MVECVCLKWKDQVWGRRDNGQKIEFFFFFKAKTKPTLMEKSSLPMRASQSILPSPRTEVILRLMSWDHREANRTGQAGRTTSPARRFRAGSDAGSVQPGAQPVDRVIL